MNLIYKVNRNNNCKATSKSNVHIITKVIHSTKAYPAIICSLLSSTL